MGLPFKDITLNLKRLNLYAAHLVVFLIPFHQKPVVWALLLFAVLNIIAFSFKTRKFYYKKRSAFIWMFSLYFIVQVASLLYTNDIQTALKDIESKMSFLLVPWLVLTCNIINKYTLPELLKTFVYGAVSAIFISFFYSLILYTKTDSINAFYYANLAYYHHAGYFALYLNFAIAILIIFIIHFRNRINLPHYFMLGFLIISVYQLSARMGIIVMCFLLAYSAVYLAFPKIKFKNPVIAISLVILCTGIFIYFSASKVDRFKSVKQDIVEKKTNTSSGSRILLWEYSLELIAKKPILGYGIGDVKDVVVEKWETENFDYALSQELNPHNQYLQTTIGTGLIGLLALLLPMVVPLFYRKNKTTNILFMLFIFNISMNCLTESILERQDGIIFYALFNSFLYFTYKD